MAATLPVKAYIGLGSNLQDPVQQVKLALRELDELPESLCLACSHLYRSTPMVLSSDALPQPDYINAVAVLETKLSAHELLFQLQSLEQTHHRVREQRWGPRTLDLDLLLYGDEVIHDDALTVPHPGLKERNFVLVPLFEIAPQLLLPDNQSLSEVLRQCPQSGLERLADV